MALQGDVWHNNAWKYSAKKANAFFAKEGIKVNLIDGSGLSRYNQISADMLMSLLIKSRKNQVIIQSLASVGKSGTLKYSKANLQKGVEVIGKTGTMGGVDAVAGYVVKKGKIKYAYVLILNGSFKDKSKRSKALSACFTRLSRL